MHSALVAETTPHTVPKAGTISQASLSAMTQASVLGRGEIGRTVPQTKLFLDGAPRVPSLPLLTKRRKGGCSWQRGKGLATQAGPYGALLWPILGRQASLFSRTSHNTSVTSVSCFCIGFCILKCTFHQAWWCTPSTPALKETEAGGSL